MSLKKSCSCRFLVPVETTIRLPDRMAGTRYARVFPVPVPASTSRCLRSASADSIASAISDWPWRYSNCGCHCDSGPLREKKWRAVGALAVGGMGQLYYLRCQSGAGVLQQGRLAIGPQGGSLPYNGTHPIWIPRGALNNRGRG